MNKKLVLVIAAVVVVAAGVFMMRGSGTVGVAPEARGTEAALPAFSNEAQHAVLKVENVEGLRKGVEFINGFLPFITDEDTLDEMSRMYENMEAFEGMDPTDSLRKMVLASKYIGAFDSFLKTADEFSFLVVSGDICLSFFTNEEKYASLKTDSNGFLNGAESWATKLAGDDGEALTVNAEFPSFADENETVKTSFYSIKRTEAGKTHVLLTSSEAAMERSLAAWKDSSARAAIKRNLELPNFMQYRFSMPAYTGGMRDVAAEIAWQGDGKMTRMDAFNDLSVFGAKPATSGLEAEAVPTFGSGEPIVLMTLDLAYMFSIAFPGVDDPAELFISMVEKTSGYEIPEQFAVDVRALLNGSRLSFGMYIKKDEIHPSTAYMLVELQDKSVIDKYFSLAAMMLPPAQIEGWEGAFSISVNPEIQVTLARQGGKVLAGLGMPSEYAVKGAKPSGMSGLPETGVLISSYVGVSALTDESTALGKLLAELMAEDEEFKEVFDKLNLGAIDSLAAVQADPQRSETRIYWK